MCAPVPEVVKGAPVGGEWQRHAAAGWARGNRSNGSFLSLNRNKRSLAVDLKAAEGKALLLEMVKTADVFIQNYRPGAARRCMALPFAADRLYLDDIGAEVAQPLRRERPRHRDRALENPIAAQNTHYLLL